LFAVSKLERASRRGSANFARYSAGLALGKLWADFDEHGNVFGLLGCCPNALGTSQQ
jgi:hypothetical protein